MALFARVQALLAAGEPCALATVIAAPGGAGAKLLVLPDGGAEGDMPEPLRAAVIAAALPLLRAGTPQLLVVEPAQVFVDVFAPPPTLVIFGGVHTAIPLSQFAR